MKLKKALNGRIPLTASFRKDIEELEKKVSIKNTPFLSAREQLGVPFNVTTKCVLRWKLLIIARDKKCVFCGHNKDLTIDHIIPKSKGGKNEVNNLQTLCQKCNETKGNKIL